MADLKISQLSSATALAGTEVVPVVQGGSTKKATIDQILSPAAGKGIDFSANGGDVLTQYDEGTWTPTWTGGTMTSALIRYTRIGRQVTCTFELTFGSSVDATTGYLNLPFTGIDTYSSGGINYTDIGAALFVNVETGNGRFGFRSVTNGAGLTSLQLSGKSVYGFLTYFV